MPTSWCALSQPVWSLTECDLVRDQHKVRCIHRFSFLRNKRVMKSPTVLAAVPSKM